MFSLRFHSRLLAVAALLAVLLSALPARAREVRIGIGYVLPPYVIRETGQGLEVEIIRRALAEAGDTVRFVYLPNLRLPRDLANGSLDAVAANRLYDLGREAGVPVYPSAETVAYHNYAISLARRGVVVHDMLDLANYRVLAFQNAGKYLGPEFRELAPLLEHYRELADQSLHVGMLYAGRTDVLISDKHIFLYWLRRLAESPHGRGLDLGQPLRFHDIFLPSPRAVFFTDRVLRDAFDRGLAVIRERGDVRKLTETYLDPQPEPVP